MSSNTECTDYDNHSMQVLKHSEESGREQSIDIQCTECGATAKVWFYSEDQNWSEPATGVSNE